MKPKVLLIGGTGFVGMHMRNLHMSKYEVITIGRDIDIRNHYKIDDLIRTLNPHVVINFAALTTVRETIDNPLENYEVGFLGTLGLLTSLRKYKFLGIFLNISSSEVYGYPLTSELPLTEDSPLRPMSPYAVNKVSVEALCYQWAQGSEFRIVTARSFTHIGPGQSDRFAISNIAKQIAEINIGKREPVVHVGNMHTTRDITDVRDVVVAYDLLINLGKNGEIYNVCSSNQVKVDLIFSKLISFGNTSIQIIQDPNLKRPQEQEHILGSYEKLHRTTQWVPKIVLDKTLFDTFKQWEDFYTNSGNLRT